MRCVIQYTLKLFNWCYHDWSEWSKPTAEPMKVVHGYPFSGHTIQHRFIQGRVCHVCFKAKVRKFVP